MVTLRFGYGVHCMYKLYAIIPCFPCDVSPGFEKGSDGMNPELSAIYLRVHIPKLTVIKFAFILHDI
jgi:hypothetical protein